MTTSNALPEISFRPVLQEDRAFLFQVYASTRETELAPVPWTPEQKIAFLAQQFEAQDLDYHRNYGDAEFLVIRVDGRDAGRLYVLRSPADIMIIDIALLPGETGRGVGTRILGDLMTEADASGRTISLHVENFNPARRLYQRLGFSAKEETGVYLHLIREPGAAQVS